MTERLVVDYDHGWIRCWWEPEEPPLLEAVKRARLLQRLCQVLSP